METLGLKAFTLFREKQFAIFFIFSMLLGAALQITNGYANTFLGSFGADPAYADTFAVKNSNALLAISQASETLCILLIPFCLKRFGIKGGMLLSMFAWVLRFGFFGIGSPEGGGLILFILSCIVYGIAFDFFNVSGGLYVDKETSPDIRSSAQGLFMIMTNGLGATIGTLGAMVIVNHNVVATEPLETQLHGWRVSWLIFAAYALVVGVAFWIIFRDKKESDAAVEKDALEYESTDGGGMTDEIVKE